jgi:hypothetical protein
MYLHASMFGDGASASSSKRDLSNYQPKWKREGLAEPDRDELSRVAPGKLRPFAVKVKTEATLGDKVQAVSMQAAFGFGMGLFVGGSVVALHSVMSQQYAGMGKRVLLAGLPFGTIFAVGSIIRSGVF